MSGGATAQTATPTPPPVTQLPPVEVVGASPLIGSGVDRNTVPAETHVLNSDDLRREGMPEPGGSLNQQVGGVTPEFRVGQSVPADILYHGFAASGLQGTPQGLAVYVNGMRFNQPFGDTVDWDLIPNIAIDRINLEGSNPVFGLNALGGAVNVQLKNGFTYQGVEAESLRRLVRPGPGRVPVRQAGRQRGDLCRRHRAAPGRLARSAIDRPAECLRRYRLARRARRAASQYHGGAFRAQRAGHLAGRAAGGRAGRAVHRAQSDQPTQYGAISLTGSVDVSDTTSVQALAYYRYFLQRVTNGNAPNDTPCNDGSGLLCSDDGVQHHAGRRLHPGLPERRSVFGARQSDHQHQRLRRFGAGHQHHELFGLKNHFVAGCQLRWRADRCSAPPRSSAG